MYESFWEAAGLLHHRMPCLSASKNPRGAFDSIQLQLHRDQGAKVREPESVEYLASNLQIKGTYVFCQL